MIAPVNELPEGRDNLRYMQMRNGKPVERDRPDVIEELIELKRELLEQDDSFELSHLMAGLDELPEEELEDMYLEAGRSSLGKFAEMPVVNRNVMLERLDSSIDWSLSVQRESAINDYVGQLGLSGPEKLAEEFNRQLGNTGVITTEKM